MLRDAKFLPLVVSTCANFGGGFFKFVKIVTSG